MSQVADVGPVVTEDVAALAAAVILVNDQFQVPKLCCKRHWITTISAQHQHCFYTCVGKLRTA